MRPIDAEALRVVTECCVDEAGFFAKFNVAHEEDINKAPTLDYKDLVPQGEWITDYKHGGIHNCSVCGEWCGGGGCTAFCPNCGARMVRK